MSWHTRDSTEVCAHLGVDPAHGLRSALAMERLAAQGPNMLDETGCSTPWRLLWEQFTSTMALILTSAAAISLVVGSLRDAAAIMAIVCLFALLGFVQEYRAERAIRALKRLAVPVVRVRRDGMVSEISAGELVTGDVLLLEAGNVVPADCRLLECHGFMIQESLLTGEAEAVEKQAAALSDPDLPVADRLNMVWMGTTATAGRGVALVTATGMGTELGRIAGLLQRVDNGWTPLQRRLDRLGTVLAAVAVAVAALVFGLGVWRGEPLREMLMTAISLAVAAIPEGLPAVVTITLAIGAQRMLKRQALIRTLPAVETLGSVTVICSDKTGTLTENRMTVTAMISRSELEDRGDAGQLTLLRMASALCNDATLRSEDGLETVVGDPTEAALLLEAARSGLYRPELEQMLPRIAEIPFDSTLKRMLTIHRVTAPAAESSALRSLGVSAGDRLVIVKGAPDAIMLLCDGSPELRSALLRRVDELAARGQRVLAVACGAVPAADPLDPTRCPQDLQLLGVAAMMDPARPEARDAVARCLKAGIRPLMITGDHPLTARSIAAEVGIPCSGGVLTGRELDRLGVEGLAERIEAVSVYSRVSPEHKLLIVQALQLQGEVVAMTGDGVNDAPALKKADIGVSMGIAGTDVAREAADMVLLDDNFATIVSAVEEGRTIYDNIIRFVEFSVAGNLGKILVVLLLPFLGLPNPLTPLQLLWLNLLTDGLLGLGMGVERPEPDVMSRRPIASTSQIFSRRMLYHTLLTGGVIGLATMLLTRHYWFSHPEGTWQTVLFSSLAFAQIGQAMALRSSRHLFLSLGMFSNPLLSAMACAVVLLQLGVVFLPPLQPIFKTVPLNAETLLLCALPGVIVFVALELEKLLVDGYQKGAVHG